VSDNERITVNCPKCEHPNGFDKSELCGQDGVVYRGKDNPSSKRREVRLFGTCNNCDYDFSQLKIEIDCEGYE
jgi:hypothetical protein